VTPLDPATAVLHPTSFVFAGLCVVAGILAVSLRNILHSILALAATLLGLAALFLYLGSPFVAAMEVVIYVGGITVAMIFAIMFAYTLGLRRETWRANLAAGLPAAAFFVWMIGVLRRATFDWAPPDRDWSLETVGRALLTHYNVVFEALSVVLLLAIVGAIGIARRDPEP
jgi:NADH-quinone oxidoreductase subunit J